MALVAGPAKDTDRAELLLARVRRRGLVVLEAVTRPAIERLLRLPPSRLRHAARLFRPDERDRLTKMLASCNATADLLGRARIRIRLDRLHRFDEATDFTAFGEPLQPLQPLSAIAFFKKLVPSLDVKVKHFGALHERQAFTMAEATGLSLLKRCKEIILKGLRTGEIGEGPDRIDKVLLKAGVHPKNPQYADMVFRTNLLDAYNAGAQREFDDPDVADAFPVWRYMGILDGRERPWHRVHFDRFFNRKVTFAEVRGFGARNVANCRCTFQPIYKSDWKALRNKGAKVTVWKGAA